jgi:hypothetical protein
MPSAFGISDGAGDLDGAGMAGFGGGGPETGGGGGSISPGGLHDAAVRSDKLLNRGTLENYKYAGVCKRMAEYCEKSCSAEADKPKAGKCGEIKTRVASAKEGGDGHKEAGGKIDPGSSGSKPSGGAPGGGGAGTQQPSTAKGGQGGGGMGDMMKALQGAMQPQNKDQKQEPFQSQTCEQNPALAGCKAKQPESDSWNKKQEKSDFQEQSKSESADNFNVGNPSDGVNTQSLGGNGGEKPVGTPSTSAGIPNGGGQIPGGSGGGGAAGGGAAGGYAGAQKNVTDVLHGAGGGGYSQMNANMQLQNGGGGGFGGYGGGAPAEYKSGVNLRDFLPGGKNDPTRKIAGGASSFEIQPQTVNIWSRISERFRARCTAGLLRDCEP